MEEKKKKEKKRYERVKLLHLRGSRLPSDRLKQGKDGGSKKMLRDSIGVETI